MNMLKYEIKYIFCFRSHEWITVICDHMHDFNFPIKFFPSIWTNVSLYGLHLYQLYKGNLQKINYN